MSKKVTVKKKVTKFVEEKVNLPGSSKNSITIFEVGDAAHGIYPTAKDLTNYRKLIENAIKKGSQGIFVPSGMLKVTQYKLEA